MVAKYMVKVRTPDPWEHLRRMVVVEGIEAVHVSGLTNMLDWFALAHLPESMGYSESALWLREHPGAYALAVFHGFEVRS